MALLDEKFESTTTVIGLQNQNQSEPNWIATGFFVAVKDKHGTGSYAYLVTNKHVIKPAIEQGYQSVKIRANLKKGGAQPIDIPLIKDGRNYFLLSPYEKADVAVIILDGKTIDNDWDKVTWFDLDDNALCAEDYLNEGGFEGSPIFMLGFPMMSNQIIHEHSMTPICRKGCIARFKADEIKNNKSFLLDLQNFPGNSGSPIISCPEIAGLIGTKTLKRAMLIGIVNGYLPYEEKLLNMQTGQVVEVRKENSGIATANPVDCIKELIENDLKSKGLL